MMQWDDRKGKYVKPFTKREGNLLSLFFNYPKFPKELITQEMKDNWKEWKSQPHGKRDRSLIEPYLKIVNNYNFDRNLWILTRLGLIGIITLTLKLGGII